MVLGELYRITIDSAGLWEEPRVGGPSKFNLTRDEMVIFLGEIDGEAEIRSCPIIQGTWLGSSDRFHVSVRLAESVIG